jgi:hypothetical protein
VVTTPPQDPQDDDREAGPLGSAVSATDEDDPAMAGPVYPPEETEPDAH